MKNFSFLLCVFLFQTTLFSQIYSPIKTIKKPTTEEYFDTIIVDNYRWLEDVYSDETINWVKQQNKLSSKYLRKTSHKTNSFSSIEGVRNTKYDYAIKKGSYYFNLYYPSLYERASLYYRNSLKKEAEKLLDPQELSVNEVINIKGYEISKNENYLAVLYGRAGSDWSEIKVLDLPSGKIHKDHLKGIKFSNIAWLNDGFFYATYDQINKFGITVNNKVYYHKLGDKQENDKLVFARKNDPLADFEFKTTSDERYFILKEINERKGLINIFFIDYKSTQQSLRPLFFKLKYDIDILENIGDELLAVSNKEETNGMIFRFHPDKPKEWKLIAPAYKEAVMLDVIPFANRIVSIYQSNQHPILTVYSYDGKLLYKLDFPAGTSIGGFNGEMNDEKLLFYMQSYTVPKVVYEFNINTFERKLVKKTGVSFNYKDIVYKNVEYLTKDSIKVPMILVFKKDIELNGNNPVILKAYGGFGVISSPSYDPGVVHFIKKGGIFAFANIRGGGDKGIEWAKAGRGKNKQNSFNDFIAAAEYLIKNKYTNKDKLAITGASNGGLVVATAAIQRPDLFKAVVPIVAPLDMLHFEKYTVGRFHIDEYGTVNDSLSFYRLLSYSPYHNIQEGVNYPAMLVITSENDDRVPPFHSYKFVAKLQNRKKQQNPVLLQVEKKAGHYGASTYVTDLRERANIYSFILYHLKNK